MRSRGAVSYGSAGQEPREQHGAGTTSHVGLEQPSPRVSHTEQPPVETVLDDASQLRAIEVGSDTSK
jgi:hypothetical protein